jgi:phosphoribosyl 1,2-cyclic phosphodiesterase
VEAGAFGVLVDAGLGPRTLGKRLEAVGADWHRVHAVLLTHTHSDHWCSRTLAQLERRGIPFYCHPDHTAVLAEASAAFRALDSAELVRFYEPGVELQLGDTLRCHPLPVPHDGGPTFGFRFEGPPDIFGGCERLAYAADLGAWSAHLARELADVDLLALEFNHDVDLEKRSGRASTLIERVLGDDGHLSNAQAAALLNEVLALSERGRLRHIVQLHLSRDCNRPELARTAAGAVLAEWSESATVHTARQDRPGPRLTLGGFVARAVRRLTRRRLPGPGQPLLPGFAEILVV